MMTKPTSKEMESACIDILRFASLYDVISLQIDFFAQTRGFEPSLIQLDFLCRAALLAETKKMLGPAAKGEIVSLTIAGVPIHFANLQPDFLCIMGGAHANRLII